MSDTGDTNAGLSARHAQFVDEYLKDRSATAAAQRCGYSVRTAGTLMAIGPIKDEIKRRLALIAVDANVSVKSLLAEVEAAREVAEQAGNASAMVAAIKLKAEIRGQMDVAQTTPEPVVATIKETVAAIFDMLKQLGYHITVRQGALGTASFKLIGDQPDASGDGETSLA